MARLIAFSMFTAAAFSWPLPWIDRAGVALLGAAFLALAVGGGRGATPPSIFAPSLRRRGEPLPEVGPVEYDLDDELATFGADGWR